MIHHPTETPRSKPSLQRCTNPTGTAAAAVDQSPAQVAEKQGWSATLPALPQSPEVHAANRSPSVGSQKQTAGKDSYSLSAGPVAHLEEELAAME